VQRIEVTGKGITVTVMTEALVSAFGKEMRPAGASVYALPWEEVSDVSISATEVGPDAGLGVCLTVSLTYGEFLKVHESAMGFAEAVLKLCQLAGTLAPDPAALIAEEKAIWPGPVQR
jgi:hypothetical protein